MPRESEAKYTEITPDEIKVMNNITHNPIRDGMCGLKNLSESYLILKNTLLKGELYKNNVDLNT